MKLLLLSPLITTTLAITYSLPPLTGPYKVGTTSLKLIDSSRRDELAPTPQKRTLLISLFYPTSETNHHAIANYSGPAVAAYVDSQFMLPGLLESLRSRAYLNAPVMKPYSPIVLFSPGKGSEKEVYTSMVEDLASRGYMVVAMDHTWDTDVTEFPDGTVLQGPELGVNATDEENLKIVEKIEAVRVKDSIFVLNQLTKKEVATKIPGVCAGLATHSVGIFGHSLGGSTAADVMLADSRVKGGVNLDGAFIGASSAGVSLLGGPAKPHGNANLKRPFLIMGAEEHNRTNDPTWAAFWAAQTGWKRQVNIKGAIHISFSDASPIVGVLGANLPLPKEVLAGLVGTIDGLQMNKIITTFVGAFFDFSLKGKRRPVLDKPSREFPEVTFAK